MEPNKDWEDLWRQKRQRGIMAPKKTGRNYGAKSKLGGIGWIRQGDVC